jgi:LysR family carnitine catabolism transcriptional activator
MESGRLRHFLAVAEHGGFTAAAQAVYVSQPALSLAVRELESELGAALFTRRGRTVRLTAAGEALVGPARQVLRDLETGQAAVAAVVGLSAGNLTLASLPTLVADPLAPLVGTFRSHFGGIRIDLAAPEDANELIEMVISGSSELGVTEDQAIPAALVSHGLGQQKLVLILPPGSPHADGDPVGLPELGDIPFVVAPPGTSTSRLLMEALAALDRSPEVAVVTAQRDAIVPLVVAGAGAALVPESLALSAGASGAVLARPEPPIVRSLTLVHRQGSLSPAADRFVAMATTVSHQSNRRSSRTRSAGPERLGHGETDVLAPGVPI